MARRPDIAGVRCQAPYAAYPGAQTRLAARDPNALAPRLQEVLYRHQGELADPRLYEVTGLGTKRVVEDFYREALDCIAYLADPTQPASVQRLRWRAFGVPPTSLAGPPSCYPVAAPSGSSTSASSRPSSNRAYCPTSSPAPRWARSLPVGSASRNDEELRDLLNNPQQIRTDAIKPLPPSKASPGVALYDSERLEEVIAHTCGNYTFGEAQARTGRTVNVSVSPTRERQKPRVLCQLHDADGPHEQRRCSFRGDSGCVRAWGSFGNDSQTERWSRTQAPRPGSTGPSRGTSPCEG